MVPRSVVDLRQQTRSPISSVLDWSPVISLIIFRCVRVRRCLSLRDERRQLPNSCISASASMERRTCGAKTQTFGAQSQTSCSSSAIGTAECRAHSLINVISARTDYDPIRLAYLAYTSCVDRILLCDIWVLFPV